MATFYNNDVLTTNKPAQPPGQKPAMTTTIDPNTLQTGGVAPGIANGAPDKNLGFGPPPYDPATASGQSYVNGQWQPVAAGGSPQLVYAAGQNGAPGQLYYNNRPISQAQYEVLKQHGPSPYLFGNTAESTLQGMAQTGIGTAPRQIDAPTVNMPQQVTAPQIDSAPQISAPMVTAPQVQAPANVSAQSVTAQKIAPEQASMQAVGNVQASTFLAPTFEAPDIKVPTEQYNAYLQPALTQLDRQYEQERKQLEARLAASGLQNSGAGQAAMAEYNKRYQTDKQVVEQTARAKATELYLSTQMDTLKSNQQAQLTTLQSNQASIMKARELNQQARQQIETLNAQLRQQGGMFNSQQALQAQTQTANLAMEANKLNVQSYLTAMTTNAQLQAEAMKTNAQMQQAAALANAQMETARMTNNAQLQAEAMRTNAQLQMQAEQLRVQSQLETEKLNLAGRQQAQESMLAMMGINTATLATLSAFELDQVNSMGNMWGTVLGNIFGVSDFSSSNAKSSSSQSSGVF